MRRWTTEKKNSKEEDEVEKGQNATNVGGNDENSN